MALSTNATQLSGTRVASSAKPFVAAARTARPARAISCQASKANGELVGKLAGAAAAVQIALVAPFAGGAYAAVPQFDLAVGEGLKAQAEASDKKVENLPSLPDVGKSLFGQSGGDAKGAAKDVAGAAQSAADDAAGAAKDAGRKVDQATPDLSANPFDDLLGKAKGAAGDASDSAQSAANDAKQAGKSLSSDASGAAGDIGKTADSAKKGIDQATPDLSANPLDDIIGKAKEATGGASGSAQDAAGGVKDLGGSVAGSAKDAAGDVSGSAKSAAGDAKSAVKSVTP